MRPFVLIGSVPLIVLAVGIAFALPVMTDVPPVPTATATVTSTPTPTVTPSPSPTATPLPPTPRPVVTDTPVPRSGPRIGSQAGSVVWEGCASDGTCYPYNFYWVPTGEIVMQGEQPPLEVAHEWGHRQQHLDLNGGAPTSIDLAAWYTTSAALSYQAVAQGWPYPKGTLLGPSLLEDWAWAYAYHEVDPGWLAAVSPARYRWMEENLP